MATPSLYKTSETFITRHVDELAPGDTAVVCFQRPRAERFDGPLCRVRLPRRSGRSAFVGKALGFVNYVRRGWSRLPDRGERAKLVRFLGRHGVDVVLAEYGHTACTIRGACREAEVPLYVHFHGFDATRLTGRWRHRYGYRRLLADTAGIICPSRFLADVLIGIGLPQNRMRVIPYGIDVEQFAPPAKQNEREDVVLAVGRMVEKKAPHHTVAAFALLAAQEPGCRLEMIGEGPLLQRCRAVAKERGVDARVTFHGARPHEFVAARMQRARVFAQHSVTAPDGDTEGLPLSILEAMASALPVVATRHAGIPEAVLEGRTGFLVDEHDVDRMAGRMLTILRSPTLAEKMGREGRKRVIDGFRASASLGRLREFMGLRMDGSRP